MRNSTNLMRAELVKLMGSALPWVVGGLCILVDVFLYAVYSIPGSSVFEASVLPLGQLASLFLGFLIAIGNVVPAVVIGCYIGAHDYSIHTAGSAVHWAGRYGPLLGKLLATAIILSGLVVGTGVFGILLGLSHDTDLGHLDPVRTLYQLGIGLIATVTLGVLALTVATLARSVAVSTLITLVALLSPMLVPPEVGQMMQFINPLAFLGGFATFAFSNLSGLTNFSLSFGSDLGWAQSIFGLIVYVCCCISALALAARYREYR